LGNSPTRLDPDAQDLTPTRALLVTPTRDRKVVPAGREKVATLMVVANQMEETQMEEVSQTEVNQINRGYRIP